MQNYTPVFNTGPMAFETEYATNGIIFLFLITLIILLLSVIWSKGGLSSRIGITRALQPLNQPLPPLHPRGPKVQVTHEHRVRSLHTSVY